MKNIILLILIIPAFQLMGQVPFFHPTQAPLQLNSSLAGSKAKKRVAVNGQFPTGGNERTNRFYCSYDQALMKAGSGIGLWYSKENKKEELSDLNKSETTESELQFINTHNSDESGIAFAPKYIVPEKHNLRILKYSVSPGFFFSYERTRNTIFTNISREYQKTYSPQHIQGIDIITDTIKFIQSDVESDRFKPGFSLMINSKTFMFMYQATHQTELTKESAAFRIRKKGADPFTYQTVHLNRNTYSVQQTLFAGKTFPADPGSKVSLTVQGGAGIRLMLSRPSVSGNSMTSYSSPYFSMQKNSINYLHASATIRLQKLIAGGGYNRYESENYTYISAGYQSKKVKITAATGLNKKRKGQIDLSGSFLF
jgi:hypothetical protein